MTPNSSRSSRAGTRAAAEAAALRGLGYEVRDRGVPTRMTDEPDAEPTLAAATEVQRLDVAAMHEKALGILATLKASGVALA